MYWSQIKFLHCYNEKKNASTITYKYYRFYTLTNRNILLEEWKQQIIQSRSLDTASMIIIFKTTAHELFLH